VTLSIAPGARLDRSRCVTMTALRSTRRSVSICFAYGDGPAQLAESSSCLRTSTYSIGQSISMYGCWGVALSLTGGQSGDGGGHPVELEWHGGDGRPPFINMNKAADSRVAGLSVFGNRVGNTAGVIIDVDNYTTGGNGRQSGDAKHDTFERLDWAERASGFASQIDRTGNVPGEPDLSRRAESRIRRTDRAACGGYFFGRRGPETYNEGNPRRSDRRP